VKRKPVASYITFSKAEKAGLVGLTLLLALLVLFRIAMPWFIQPAHDEAQEQAIRLAWQKFKAVNNDGSSIDTAGKTAFQKSNDQNAPPLPMHINLNTVDSATLVRIKGIGPVTASKIVAWRKTHGPFTNLNQLFNLGSFSKKNFSLLRQHLVLKPTPTEKETMQ